MTNIQILQDALVASLRDIPELVSDLGGNTEAIQGLDVQSGMSRSVRESIAQMTDVSLLVAFRGCTPAARGTFERWRFQFTIAMRAPGEYELAQGTHPGYYALFSHIIDGIPTSQGGLRWLDSTIHPDFDPPIDPVFLPSQDGDGTEFWELGIALLEIGG